MTFDPSFSKEIGGKMDPTVSSENKSQDIEHHAPRDYDQGQGKPDHHITSQ